MTYEYTQPLEQKLAPQVLNKLGYSIIKSYTPTDDKNVCPGVMFNICPGGMYGC